MVVDEELLEKMAAAFIGTPYLSGGRSEKGTDCLGLVTVLLGNLGFEIPDPEEEVGWTEDRQDFIVAGLHKWVIPVKIPEPGDLVLFAKNSFGHLNHVGLVLGCGRFIHSTKMHGVVIHRLRQMPFHNRIRGYYRIREEMS